eukprot:400002-Prorocentrum_minimum.AAC.1
MGGPDPAAGLALVLDPKAGAWRMLWGHAVRTPPSPLQKESWCPSCTVQHTFQLEKNLVIAL